VHNAYAEGLIDREEKETSLNALLISLDCLEDLEAKQRRLNKC